MTHAATHTAVSVSSTKAVYWSQSLSIAAGTGVGPLEWTVETTEAIDLFLSGVYPGADTAIRLEAGETFTILSVNRSITLIEMDAVSTTSSVHLRPSVV